MLQQPRPNSAARTVVQGRTGPSIVYEGPGEARVAPAVPRLDDQSAARSAPGFLARLLGALRGFAVSSPVRPKPELPPQPSVTLPGAAMSARAHWTRVADVIDRATSSALLVREAQARARAQLEMAEYALDLLFEEVATVMPLAPKVRPLRPSSAVTPSRPLAIAA